MNHHNSNNHHPKKFDLNSWSLTSDISISAEEALGQDDLAEIWARRAYALAEPPPVEVSGQTLDLLVFLLNGERYGLEVTQVREIYPLEQLTPVPRTPDFVAGVFSARGRLISVIDPRVFLGLPSLSPGHERREQGGVNHTKIIVIATADLEVGLLADEVVNMLTIFKDDLEPALTTQTGSQAEFVEGVTAGMLVVLNLKALLSDKRLIVHEGDKI